MNRAFIKRVEYYLPEKVLKNAELSALYPEWTEERIESKTGICARHVAAEGETSLDMAEQVCNKMFANSDFKKEDVDFLILMTETPDYYLPSSACILHGRLDLDEKCGAFDINLGCSAYIYGLILAKSLIVSGTAKNVLLVTADTYTKLIHPMDKSTRTLFGDAATATWISGEGMLSIEDSVYGTRGKRYDDLLVPAGAFRKPKDEETRVVHIDENGYSRSEENIFMDGANIMAFSIDVVPKTLKELLIKAGIEDSDIALYVFHQANDFMLSYLQKKLKIEDLRFAKSFSDTGNTVSSSIPIVLSRYIEKDMLPKGNIVLCGFGVGLSWGALRLVQI